MDREPFLTRSRQQVAIARATVRRPAALLLDRGRCVQAGPPTELYRRPATLFAARFLG